MHIMRLVILLFETVLKTLYQRLLIKIYFKKTTKKTESIVYCSTHAVFPSKHMCPVNQSACSELKYDDEDAAKSCWDCLSA